MGKNSRTLLERANDIFKFIQTNIDKYSDTTISKSDFQEIGISPKDMEQWLELILFIQRMPRLRVRKEGVRTHVDTLENDLMIYLRQKFQNANLSFEERHAAISMYLKVLINVEKMRGDDIDWKEMIDDPWEINRPTIFKLAEEFVIRENE